MTTESPPLCPKCEAPMAQGFTVDMGGGDAMLSTRQVSRWAPGAPMWRVVFGTRLPKGVLPIGTYRCEACGYLESYARPEFASAGRRQFSLRQLFILMTVVAVVLGFLMALRFWRGG